MGRLIGQGLGVTGRSANPAVAVNEAGGYVFVNNGTARDWTVPAGVHLIGVCVIGAGGSGGYAHAGTPLEAPGVGGAPSSILVNGVLKCKANGGGGGGASTTGAFVEGGLGGDGGVGEFGMPGGKGGDAGPTTNSHAAGGGGGAAGWTAGGHDGGFGGSGTSPSGNDSLGDSSADAGNGGRGRGWDQGDSFHTGTDGGVGPSPIMFAEDNSIAGLSSNHGAGGGGRAQGSATSHECASGGGGGGERRWMHLRVKGGDVITLVAGARGNNGQSVVTPPQDGVAVVYIPEGFPVGATTINLSNADLPLSP